MTGSDGGRTRILILVGVGIVALLGLLILGIVAVGALVFFGGGPSEAGIATPDTTFEFERTDASVTVSYVEGPALESTAVWVMVGADGLGTWADFEAGEQLQPGDQIQVSVLESGDEIRLRWSPPEGQEPQVIASYTVP